MTGPDVPGPDLPDPDLPDSEIPDPDLPDSEIPDPDDLGAEIPEPRLPNSEIPDPDVQQAREAADSGTDQEALGTDELRPESDLTEFEPPDDPTTPTADRETLDDQRRGETIDERLAQEEPDWPDR